MAFSRPFNGYNGAVWAVALASMEYLGSLLTTTTDYISLEPIIDATLQTLLNGVDTINQFNYYNCWQVELQYFQNIVSLPLANAVGGLTTAQTRFNTYKTAVETLGFSVNIPNVTQTVHNLKFAQPAISDPKLLEFCFNFNVEPAPDGLTQDNFVAAVQTLSDNFASLANAVATAQGRNLSQAYDTALRQHSLTQIQANLLAKMHASERINRPPSVISSVITGVGTAGREIQYIWNQLAVLPTLLKDAELIGNTPNLENTQQALLQKFIMLTMAQNLALFLLSLQQPLTQNIKMTRISNGQSLMDIAAHKLQNFESWKTIATTNNLKPPWIVQSSNDPAIAQWGQQLVLPGSQSGIRGKPPSYQDNFLGVDLYLGGLEQDMPEWNGDFQTISGYENLRISLARRLLTEIGSLIYHSSYGSEVPAMIGTIASQGEAAYITALASAALLSDPRVAQIVNADTRSLGGTAFRYSSSVIPKGMTEQSVAINQVIT